MNDLKRQSKQIEKALARSSVELPLPVKLRIAELILRLRHRRGRFGLFIILGWRNKWKKYADTPDVLQDIFRQRHMNVMDGKVAKRKGIVRTIDFDGAILVDRRGNVLHSGTMIEGLRPRAVAHALHPRRAGDLSSRFGFKHKVHMRHIAAIVSSYVFKGTTIFTVSEETGDFHIFERGKIVYSTVRGE